MFVTIYQTGVYNCHFVVLLSKKIWQRLRRTVFSANCPTCVSIAPKKHLLIDVVISSVSAVLSGAESWDAIELYGVHADLGQRRRSLTDKKQGLPRTDFRQDIRRQGLHFQSLFEELFVDGIHLVTKPRKNIKNSLMHESDKILLRKRYQIETINDQLKNICQIEYTRHRSFANFIANLISGLIVYSFLPKKPTLNLENSDCMETNLAA